MPEGRKKKTDQNYKAETYIMEEGPPLFIYFVVHALKWGFSAMCFIMLPNVYRGKRLKKEKEMIQEKITKNFKAAIPLRGP